jgi:hypothetical protein
MDWEGALVRFRNWFAFPEVQSSKDHTAGNLRRAEGTISYGVFFLKIQTRLKAELRGLIQRANFTDRETAACRAS